MDLTAIWLEHRLEMSREEAPSLSWSVSSKTSSSDMSPCTSKHPSPLTKWHQQQDLPLLPKLSPAAIEVESFHSREPTTSSSVSSSVVSEDEDEVKAPANFDVVNPGLYRSSFPRTQHFGFLRSLGLKTVVAFTPDEYPQANRDFLEEEGITFLQIPMPGNKEETIRVEPASIEQALKVILDPQNYPVLMHCNKGRHRTGCVVGCLRKLQNWPMEQILEEYIQFSQPKSRPMDQQCIRQFLVDPVWEFVKDRPRPVWLQQAFRAELYESPVISKAQMSTSTICLPERTDSIATESTASSSISMSSVSSSI